MAINTGITSNIVNHIVAPRFQRFLGIVQWTQLVTTMCHIKKSFQY